MHILKAATFLVLVLTAHAWIESVETSVTAHDQRICNKGCYAAYRHLIGDELEDTGYYSASHQSTAEIVCESEQCTECEFCDPSLTSHFPILSLQKVELNRMANAEARMRVGDEEPTNCMDCQEYLDDCEHYSGHDVEFLSLGHEDKLRYALHEADHRKTLQCELLLCTDGPTHCGINGRCERRICKDLAARIGLVQPAHTLDCRNCFKPWVECMHDRCFTPTHDAIADRLPGLDCFKKDVEECQQSSRRQLNAKVAPDQGCVARCWAETPIHCHTSSCALTFSASTVQSSTGPPLTSAQHHLGTLAFRNTCLETCDLGNTYYKCTEKCKELHGAFDNHRERCEETCEEKTGGHECKGVTCYVGPERYREGGREQTCNT